MMDSDKLIERARYDGRAQLEMADITSAELSPLGSQAVISYLRTPYIFYEQEIIELVRPSHRVLELGAGAGFHTGVLMKTGAQVIASDISANALALLRKRFQNSIGNLRTEVADIESLPFEASSFDVVVSAGCLSYGDPQLVDAEIRRILRPGGLMICVDSLNHNPIYRMNRWIQYLRGKRTKSTLRHMPDLPRINAMGSGFHNVIVRYFGALSFAMPIVAALAGENAACAANDQIDQLISTRRLAFKFVLVAQGFG
jgi:SAM-dependent methyltransferase